MQNFSKLKKHFDGTDENLLRSTHPGVIDEHLCHYQNRLDSFIKKETTERILDFGCGDGRILYEYSKLFPNKEFVGVDLSSENIDIAKEKFKAPNIEFIIGNGADKDMVDLGFFDLIFSFSVIQYFDNESCRILSNNLSDILRDDGLLVHMSIPDNIHFYRSTIASSQNFYFFTLAKVVIKLLMRLFVKERRYGNGFWWDQQELENLHQDSFQNLRCYQSNVWYRFDFFAEKKKS